MKTFWYDNVQYLWFLNRITIIVIFLNRVYFLMFVINYIAYNISILFNTRLINPE